MNKIRSEKNNIGREIAEMDTGLSKKQLLALSEAITCFADYIKASQDNLELEDKRKILRLLIQEIQIGKEDITINHIIPIKSDLADKIACLDAGCGGTEAQSNFYLCVLNLLGRHKLFGA